MSEEGKREYATIDDNRRDREARLQAWEKDCKAEAQEANRKTDSLMTSFHSIFYELGYMAGVQKAWGQAIVAVCAGVWICVAIRIAVKLWGGH